MTEIEYREGQIWPLQADGTFGASYLNRLSNKPYQAIAGQGYGFATVEAAQAAIDAAIAAQESPIMHLWRSREPDSYHGWQVQLGDLYKCPQLREISTWSSGNGQIVSDSVAFKLGQVVDGQIEFTAADVIRVAAGVAEWQAQRAAERAADPMRQIVQCDCGHSVARSQVMSASLGSSCFDCYDRMSG